MPCPVGGSLRCLSPAGPFPQSPLRCCSESRHESGDAPRTVVARRAAGGPRRGGTGPSACARLLPLRLSGSRRQRGSPGPPPAARRGAATRQIRKAKTRRKRTARRRKTARRKEGRRQGGRKARKAGGLQPARSNDHGGPGRSTLSSPVLRPKQPQSLRANVRKRSRRTCWSGLRLWCGAEIHADAMMWQGFGLSDTFGIEDFPNGDAFKAGTANPRLHVLAACSFVKRSASAANRRTCPATR